MVINYKITPTLPSPPPNGNLVKNATVHRLGEPTVNFENLGSVVGFGKGEGSNLDPEFVFELYQTARERLLSSEFHTDIDSMISAQLQSGQVNYFFFFFEGGNLRRIALGMRHFRLRIEWALKFRIPLSFRRIVVAFYDRRGKSRDHVTAVVENKLLRHLPRLSNCCPSTTVTRPGGRFVFPWKPWFCKSWEFSLIIWSLSLLWWRFRNNRLLSVCKRFPQSCSETWMPTIIIRILKFRVSFWDK